jgi:hypothetical protein
MRSGARCQYHPRPIRTVFDPSPYGDGTDLIPNESPPERAQLSVTSPGAPNAREFYLPAQ